MENLIEATKKLEELASKKHIKDLKVSVTQAYVYRNAMGGEDPPSVAVSGSYLSENSKDKDDFTTEASEELTKLNMDFDFDLAPALKGNKFPKLVGITPIAEGAKPTNVEPKEGEVTLFDFWATWCGPCQGPMGHNQEMLAHHPEWAGKVRIVGVSIDNDVAAPRNRVSEKGWNKVEHYWAPGGWSSSVCKQFAIQGIPFCVLVDKKGIIKLTGHPASMDLENNFVKLMNDQEIGGAGENGASLKNKDYSYEKAKADLTKFMADHKEDFEKVKTPLLAAVATTVSKDGKNQLQDAFLVVRFDWSSKVAEAVNKIKNGIKNVFEPNLVVKMQDKQKILHTLTFGSKCKKCSKELGECNQYKCICCPDFYLCTECVDKHVDPKTLEDLPHEHGLYYIQAESKPVLSDIELGNLKPGHGDIKDKSHSSCRCDFCRVLPVGIRWKCANCFSVDCCDACFKIAKDPTHKDYAELMEKAKAHGHDMKTHVYVRAEFPGFIQLPY